MCRVSRGAHSNIGNQINIALHRKGTETPQVILGNDTSFCMEMVLGLTVF